MLVCITTITHKSRKFFETNIKQKPCKIFTSLSQTTKLRSHIKQTPFLYKFWQTGFPSHIRISPKVKKMQLPSQKTGSQLEIPLACIPLTFEFPGPRRPSQRGNFPNSWEKRERLLPRGITWNFYWHCISMFRCAALKSQRLLPFYRWELLNKLMRIKKVLFLP